MTSAEPSGNRSLDNGKHGFPSTLPAHSRVAESKVELKLDDTLAKGACLFASHNSSDTPI